MIERDPLGGVEHAAIAEEIAGAARHDLRNRLASISGAAFYLRRRVSPTPLWGSDPRVERFFGLIDEEVTSATELLDQKLRLAHLGARRGERVDAAACVRKAVACARVASGAGVRVEITAGEGDVHADAAELALAVRCLVENAVEATPAGGAVHVQAAVRDAEYAIAVGDGGPALDEAQAERAIEPFFTTKDGRVGLGLNIARRIAQRYRGSLALSPGIIEARALLLIPLVDGKIVHEAPPGG